MTEAELEAQKQSLIEEKELILFVTVITDILNSNWQVIVLGKRADLVETAFKVKLIDHTALLTGIVSRKKQIVPVMDRLI